MQLLHFVCDEVTKTFHHNWWNKLGLSKKIFMESRNMIALQGHITETSYVDHEVL